MWAPVWWGMLLLGAAALCAGTGAVLQAQAARSVDTQGSGLHPTLLLALVRQSRFLAGIGLDLVSFGASFAALRVLPVFLVQAGIAANLAVTAVVAWRVLGTHLRWIEIFAIAGVCVGLAGVGLSAAQQGAGHGSLALHFALLCGTGVLAALGFVAGRLSPRLSAAALGSLAGLAFGLVNVASRVLPSLSPADLATDPAIYAIPLAGACAVLFYNTALQWESVVAASAGTIVGQTAFPAAVGLLLLGDDTRPGYEAPGIVGFVLAVVASLLLARFGDLSEDTPRSSESGTPAVAGATMPAAGPVGSLGRHRGRGSGRAGGGDRPRHGRAPRSSRW